MAGLLDFLNTPAGQGLLSGVASYAMNARRGTPVNNLGRGLAGGITGYAQANDQIRQDKEKQLADQYRQMQMDEILRKRADQDTYRAQFKPAGQEDYQADNPFGEDLGTLKNETPPMFAGQPINPRLAAIAPFLDPKEMYSALGPTAPIKLGKGDRLVDPVTYQPMTDMPPAQEDDPDKVRQYKFAQQGGYQGSYIDFLKVVPEAQADAMYPWRAAEAADRARARDIDERQADYTLPRGKPRQQASPGFSVRAPDGNTYSFPSQAAADQFKRSIGGR